MSRTPDSIRKAAILVATLDARTADALLDQMAPADADLVRRAAVAIDVIDSQEQEAIIREFLGLERAQGTEVPYYERSTPIQARRASECILSDQDALACASSLYVDRPATRNEPPFRFLHETDCLQWMPYLEREHPQTIAVVASHLPPEQAAQLLAQLQPALQADVLRRLVDLDEMHPEVVRDLENELESRLSHVVNRQHRRAAGIAAAASILAAADGRLEREILANLTVHAPQLAGQLRPNGQRQYKLDAQASALGEMHSLAHRACTMSFDDLTQMDTAALIDLFRQADPQVVILALAGSEPMFVERLLTAIPAREAQVLRSAWHNLGPTQLSDVDEAQQELVALAMERAACPR